MRIINIFTIAITGFILTSCNSEGRYERLLHELTLLETRIAESGRPQPAQLDSLVLLYEQLISASPKDSNNVKYLLKAAESARTNFKFDDALKFYDQILKEFATSPNASQALFMKGFILENDLHNLDSARAVYNLFIQTYPTHELVDDAQFLINNLGRSDEEIIKEFETKQEDK